MLDVMSQAKNAIEAYNSALKVSSANIANMNVPCYKKLNISFQSIFEKYLNSGSAASGSSGGTNPQQFGQGVAVSGVMVDTSAGETTAGSSLDLAIAGSGFFIVSPDGGNNYMYTRTGNFSIDSAGNLLSNNMQVYGLDNSGNLVPISNLRSGTRTNYQWLSDGRLQYTDDPTAVPPVYTDTGYSIALTYFPNPSGLMQSQGTALAQTIASGSPAAAQGPGGFIGSLKPGQIEQSNVVYLAETITSLEMQRALSGNLNMVKMASDLISSFISKLG